MSATVSLQYYILRSFQIEFQVVPVMCCLTFKDKRVDQNIDEMSRNTYDQGKRFDQVDERIRDKSHSNQQKIKVNASTKWTSVFATRRRMKCGPLRNSKSTSSSPNCRTWRIRLRDIVGERKVDIIILKYG